MLFRALVVTCSLRLRVHSLKKFSGATLGGGGTGQRRCPEWTLPLRDREPESKLPSPTDVLSFCSFQVHLLGLRERAANASKRIFSLMSSIYYTSHAAPLGKGRPLAISIPKGAAYGPPPSSSSSSSLPIIKQTCVLGAVCFSRTEHSFPIPSSSQGLKMRRLITACLD